jgi:hypothetical protein
MLVYERCGGFFGLAYQGKDIVFRLIIVAKGILAPR